MARRHYHVGVNTVGYLPEGDVYRVETKAEALAEARRMRDEILENGYGPMLPEGTCEDCDHHRSEHIRSRGHCSAPYCTCAHYAPGGVKSTGRDGDYYIGDGQTWHLAAHVWVSPCSDDDCDQAEE